MSYAILAWSPTLGMKKTYQSLWRQRQGFRYYEDDDRGIFWSNDPHMTVGQMLRSLNQMEEKEYFNSLSSVFVRRAFLASQKLEHVPRNSASTQLDGGSEVWKWAQIASATLRETTDWSASRDADWMA